MIKAIGVIALMAGALLVILGILGVLGNLKTGLSPWVFIVLGCIFFFSGSYLLIHSEDTDALDR